MKKNNANYVYRQILLENSKDLEIAINNIELLRAANHAKTAERIINEFDSEQISTKIFCCALIEYLNLIKKSYYEGLSLSNDEWNFLNDYSVSKDKKSDDKIKSECISRINIYIKEKYYSTLNNNSEEILNELISIKERIGELTNENEKAFNKKREERHQRVSDAEKENITNEIVRAFYINARLQYSIQSRIIIYDIENTKSESKAQRKLAYWIKWKKYVCDYQNIVFHSNSYFIEDDECLFKEILEEKNRADSNIWLDVLLVNCLMFEPYTSIQTEAEKESNSLKLSSDYVTDILCEKYSVFDEKTIKSIRETAKASLKKLNHTNEKVVAVAVSSVLITALTGGLASAFAPAIAVSLVGESLVGLSGAALTNASLAMIGGGSLAAGGFGMAGGAAVITGGGAAIGALSSIPSTAVASILIDGIGLKSCVKLITLSKILLKDYNNDTTKAVINIIGICNEYIQNSKLIIENITKLLNEIECSLKNETEKISIIELKQSSKELPKIKRNMEKNIKYYEKTIQIIKDERVKAERAKK